MLFSCGRFWHNSCSGCRLTISQSLESWPGLSRRQCLHFLQFRGKPWADSYIFYSATAFWSTAQRKLVASIVAPQFHSVCEASTRQKLSMRFDLCFSWFCCFCFFPLRCEPKYLVQPLTDDDINWTITSSHFSPRQEDSDQWYVQYWLGMRELSRAIEIVTSAVRVDVAFTLARVSRSQPVWSCHLE